MRKLNKQVSVISGLTTLVGLSTMPFIFILGYSLAIGGAFVLAMMIIDSVWMGDQASGASSYTALGPGGSGGEKRHGKYELDPPQE